MKIFLEKIQANVRNPILKRLLECLYSNPLDEALCQNFVQVISDADSQGLYSKLFIEALERFKTINHSTLSSPEERLLRYFNILPPLLLSPRFATVDIFIEANLDFREDFGLILNALAEFYARSDQVKKAEMIFSRALDIRRDLALENSEQRINIVETLVNIGNLMKNSNEAENLPQAGEAYYEAVILLQELYEEDPETISHQLAQPLRNLAEIYEKLEHYEAAEKCLSAAIQSQQDFVEEDTQIAANVARTFTKLASLKERQKIWEEAETCYKQAVLIRRDLALEDEKYKSELAEALYNIAMHYSRVGRLEAEEAFNEAARIYKRLGDEGQEQNTLRKLASFFRNIGKIEEANKIQLRDTQVELKQAKEDF
ncbi:MAG: hypothetical protein ACFFBD_18895 [Candidatus Hodarchaeota archaeon]